MIDFSKYEGTDDAVFRVCPSTDTMDSSLPSSVKKNCDHCGREVWYSTLQQTVVQETFIICGQCAQEHLHYSINLPNNNVPPGGPPGGANSPSDPLVIVSDEDGHYVGIRSLLIAYDQYLLAYRHRMQGEVLADFFISQAEFHIGSLKAMFDAVLHSMETGELSEDGIVASIKVFNLDEAPGT